MSETRRPLSEDIFALREEVTQLYTDIARFREELGTMIEKRLQARIDYVISTSKLEEAFKAIGRLEKSANEMAAFSAALKKHGSQLRKLTFSEMEALAQKVAILERRYERMKR